MCLFNASRYLCVDVETQSLRAEIQPHFPTNRVETFPLAVVRVISALEDRKPRRIVAQVDWSPAPLPHRQHTTIPATVSVPKHVYIIVPTSLSDNNNNHLWNVRKESWAGFCQAPALPWDPFQGSPPFSGYDFSFKITWFTHAKTQELHSRFLQIALIYSLMLWMGILNV